MPRWDRQQKGKDSGAHDTADEISEKKHRVTFESDPEALRQGIVDKVEALEELYKTDVIGVNADLEDIAAKYNKLIPPEEVEKHKEMVSFLLQTMDLAKVAAARESGNGKAADKEFTKASPPLARTRW